MRTHIPGFARQGPDGPTDRAGDEVESGDTCHASDDTELYSTILGRLCNGESPLPDSIEDQVELAGAVKRAWERGEIQSIADVRRVAERLNATRLADRLKANDLRVLFVRHHASRYPKVWAELFDTCYDPRRRRYSRHALRRLSMAAGGGGKVRPSRDAFLPAAFQEWAVKHRLDLEAPAGLWLQAMAFGLRRTRALPWELHHSFSCLRCTANAPGHTVGSHWGASRAETSAERDAQEARESGQTVPFRKKRAAAVAVEALIRNTFAEHSWNEIAATLSERRESKSEEAVRELALDAARLLGFTVRKVGQPLRTKD